MQKQSITSPVTGQIHSRNDRQQTINSVLEELIELALEIGASAATTISVGGIHVEEELAALCEEPRCENYGQSASCPPHVSGPSGFRKLIRKYTNAVVFKIDVPTEILLSDQRREIFQLLHDIAAGIEQAAVKKGCASSKAFAGGSCKQIFCSDQANCRVTVEGKGCRNPERARPSMSGFGINVHKLMQAAGWPMERITRDTDPDQISMGSVTGLVLIC